jgi:excisionase family DNA binding protein
MNQEANTIKGIEQRITSLEKLLVDFLNARPSIQEHEFLTVAQAADLLCKSIHTLYGMVSRREIPHIKKGNRLYFNRQELITWLQEGERLPLALQ